jgi:hypothetical protein
MNKQEDYRHTAAEIVELAQKATTVIEKRRLLRLAEMWLDLAVRSGRKAAQSQQQIGDHPLVRKALGSDPAGVQTGLPRNPPPGACGPRLSPSCLGQTWSLPFLQDCPVPAAFALAPQHCSSTARESYR